MRELQFYEPLPNIIQFNQIESQFKNWQATLTDLSRVRRQVTFDIVDLVNEGRITFFKRTDGSISTLPDDGEPLTFSEIAVWLQIEPATLSSYCSTMSRYPRDQRPAGWYEHTYITHWQKVDRKGLTYQQSLALIARHIAAVRNGGYDDHLNDIPDSPTIANLVKRVDDQIAQNGLHADDLIPRPTKPARYGKIHCGTWEGDQLTAVANAIAVFRGVLHEINPDVSVEFDKAVFDQPAGSQVILRIEAAVIGEMIDE